MNRSNRYAIASFTVNSAGFTRSFSGLKTLAFAVYILGSISAVDCNAASDKLLHNSTNLGNKYGNWGTDYTCQTCHIKGASINVKKLRSSIVTPIGVRPVTFNRYTGYGNNSVGIFGNDERSVNAQGSRNICEICHHNTAYHQYSSSKIGDKVHTSHKSNRKDCTDCHKHSVGYKPPDSKACNVCHGYPPVDNTYYGGPAGMLVPPTLALGGTVSTPPSNVGAHNRHRNELGFECSVCHNGSGHGYAGNDIIEFGFNIDQTTWPPFSGVVTNGEIVATSSPEFRYQFAVAPGNSSTTLMRSPDFTTCNIYCHGGFWNYTSGRSTNSVSWVQGPLGSCENSSCHGTTSANPPTPVILGNTSTGAHKTHVAKLGNDKAKCATCHDDYYSQSRHMVNGSVKVNLSSISPVAAYKGFSQISTSYLATTGIYGSCTNIYCHSNVQSSDGSNTATSFKSVAWGGSLITCAGCHDGKRDDTSVIATGSHGRHLSVYSYSCADCHTGAGNDVPTRHADSNIDVSFGASYGGSYSQIPNLPGDGYGNCSANYCHSDGNGVTKSVGWGTGPQSCSSCHNSDLASGSPIDTGMHTQHINQAAVIGRNLSCADCHAATVSTGLTISNLSLHVNGFKDFSGALSGKNSSSCNTAYCHSDGKGGAGTVVNWSSGPALIDCKGCHGVDASPTFTSVAGEPNYPNSGPGTLRANSHQRHMGGIGTSTCIYCHNETVSSSGVLTTTTLHLDGTRNVAAGGGRSFTFDPVTLTCSTISCHGAGAPAAQWGQSLPADCTGCHGGNSSSAIPLASGRHPAHVNNASILGTNFGCAECHASTASGDTTLSASSTHANGFINFSGGMAGRNISACSAAYCHSDGKGSTGRTVDWSAGPALDCDGCHGNASGTGTFISVAGEPNYPSEGGLRANSHDNHTKKISGQTGAASCDICHTGTVITSGASIKAGSAHLNRQIDLDFNRVKEGTAVWTAGSRTCSNIACHNGGSAVWGDASSAGCSVCHPSLSGAHLTHVGDLMGSGIVTMYNYTANRSSGSFYRYGCANCHPTDLAKHRNGTVDIDLSSTKQGVSFLGGLNSLVTVPSAGYTRISSTQFTCDLVYCHSNGKNLSQISGDYRQSPNWYGGAFTGNKCGMCHDNPPQYAGQSHYVADSSLGSNGRPTLWESGHMVGIHFKNTTRGNKQSGFLGYSSSGSMAHGNPALATTISCNLCHSGIVSSSQIDTYAMNGTSSKFRCANCHGTSTRTPLQTGAIIDTSQHINGTKNIRFAPVAVKTKAQLSNVANALGWGRYGSYKAADSYDSFDLSVSTWDAQTKTCLTACHVNQPGITWGAGLQCSSCHANQ